jgi:lipoate-protein ligase A
MASGKLIPLHSGGPAENMAIDQMLLESVDSTGVPILRFYQWDQPTLSLGYFQRLADRARHPQSQRAVCVRRATGGGAILHDREITYSIVMPIRSSDTASRQRLYQWVHQSVLDVLATFGVRAGTFAQLGGRLGREDAFLCFQRRTEQDLIVSGYKILGSAQRRSRAAVLQHGSVLMQASALAPQLPGIADLTGRNLDPNDFVCRLTRQLGRTLGVRWVGDELSVRQRSRSRQIEVDRFATPQWIGRR